MSASASIRPSMRFSPGFTQLYQEYCDSSRGQKLLKLAGISRAQLDVPTMIQDYFSQHTGDMSVDPNANVGNSKCPNNFSTEVVKGVSKLAAFHLLWSRLSEEFDEETASELISKIWKGYYYFHDLSGHGVTAPYCFAASTLPLVFNGRPYGQLVSIPPKRASSFISQAIEYTMDLSQEFMGAVALGDLLVNLSMFCQKDGIDPDKPEGLKFIRNELQKLVHVVNNKFRTGAQSPFTNISVFDKPQIEGLFKEYEFPDGSKAVNFIPYIMKVQEIFLDFMAKKDPSSGLPYRFPIVTVNITTHDHKVLDPDFLNMVCKYNTEGLFNCYITEGVGKVASCCRLLNDVKRIRERQRSDVFGNGGFNIGSTRVVTINLARLAFESGGPVEFKALLKRAVDETTLLLMIHRKILADLIEAGYLKFFKPLNWISLDMLFSTIGLVGLYEALEQFGEDYKLPSKKGVKKAQELLQFVDSLALKKSEELNVPFNVEQVPAEQASVTLAKADKIFFPTSGYEMYSNQSIPLWVDVDLITRAQVDGALSKSYSGGCISHLNLGSSVTPEQMKSMIEFAIQTGLDHFALNMVFCRCEQGHTFIGQASVCPKCGGKIVVKETRVVGYMVPVSDWAEARREWEFPKRAWVEMPDLAKAGA